MVAYLWYEILSVYPCSAQGDDRMLDGHHYQKGKEVKAIVVTIGFYTYLDRYLLSIIYVVWL